MGSGSGEGVKAPGDGRKEDQSGPVSFVMRFILFFCCVARERDREREVRESCVCRSRAEGRSCEVETRRAKQR